MKYLILIFALPFFMLSCRQNIKKTALETKNTILTGAIFGTTYKAIYNSDIDYTTQFDSLFDVINTSMSTYIYDSDISKLNRNEQVEVDHHFDTVFKTAKIIYTNTKGVFDPTIGDVVNAWSFGAENNKFLTDAKVIDSLMQHVGFNKVKLTDAIIKKPKGTYLEFNAIAKGYGVDVISNFLEKRGIANYLVEIGGEIRVKGKNVEKNALWTIGVDEPRFDGGQSIYKIINLKDEAMATSGTYRKFNIDENGNKYAHIINTKTGYPSKTNILSVSVIAKECMVADGYATAFQAMGIEGIRLFLNQHPELKVFLIFENKDKEFETLALNGFPVN